MSNAIFRASGVDPNDGAKIVYVWCRDKNQDSYTLIGSGYVVGAQAGLPPGIRPGQFCVVFILPPGHSADTIVITDDTNGKEFLPNVSVIPCATSAVFHPGVGAISDGAAADVSTARLA
jgi:hypothetical protein